MSVGWSVNGIPRQSIEKSMGEIPIMIRVCEILKGLFDIIEINIL